MSERRRYVVVMPRWPAAGAGHLVRVVMLAYKSIDEPLPACKARPVHLRFSRALFLDAVRCVPISSCLAPCFRSMPRLLLCVGSAQGAGGSVPPVCDFLRAASLGVCRMGWAQG